MTNVYVVGTDMIKFGRFPERTVDDLGAEAALLALADCGLTIADMQAVYCGNLFQASAAVGQRVLKQIGQTGVPVVNTANACATGATAFREGWMAIKAGVYDLVLAVGVEQMGKGLLGGGGGKDDGIPTEGLLGSGTMPSVFAHVGLEHSRKYGTTFEQFAKVSVKNHHHSTLNPKAMYRVETPLEEVMNAEMISYPNTKLMCSVNVDGAAAAVLASEKKARELGMKRAVRVRASVLTSDPWQERDLVMPDVNTCTRLAAQQAYEMAGISAADLDLVELHDCFATAEILHYENLGLCADGEAGRMIDENATALGGKIPVNVSGGLLSKGHPLGATGIANIYEVSTHLRGEAGKRQVEGARRAVAENGGGFYGVEEAATVVTVLARG
jgi:acetyl-CoA acyltransferase